jgi:hypothetical protein
VRLKGLDKLKKFTSSGLEAVTFQLAAWRRDHYTAMCPPPPSGLYPRFLSAASVCCCLSTLSSFNYLFLNLVFRMIHSACYPFLAIYLLCLLFDPEDWGSILLQNISELQYLAQPEYNLYQNADICLKFR